MQAVVRWKAALQLISMKNIKLNKNECFDNPFKMNKIKVLNTINFKKSMRYNPFHYIRSEKDILKLVNTIIANTKGDGEKSGEDFWVSATRSQTVKSLRTSNGFPLFGELVV